MSTLAASAKPTGIADEKKFNLYLLQLVGEPFLFARKSYGDELVLNFGELQKAPSRKVRGVEFVYEHGTYRVLSRGSAWLMKSGTRIATNGLMTDLDNDAIPVDKMDFVTNPPISVGAVVTGIKPFSVLRPGIDGIGLRVDVSDGSTIVVIPTPEESTEVLPPEVQFHELSDWEVITPSGRIEVGPGRKWSWFEKLSSNAIATGEPGA